VVGWFVATLRSYPELAIFLALAIGFTVGPLKFAGFSLGNVTATLIAALIIGQLGISVSPNVKAAFFIMFIFAIGYGVGPQFVSGFGKEGPRQVAFSLVILALCLIAPLVCAKLAGLDVGYAAGLYSGSQTISAAMGVASDQIARLNLSEDQTKTFLNQIPIGYAVTYIFGTIGSAIILAQLGPKLIGVDLVQACKDYEKQLGGGQTSAEPGVFSAYRKFELARLPDSSGQRHDRQAGRHPAARPARVRGAYSPRREGHRRGCPNNASSRRRGGDVGPPRVSGRRRGLASARGPRSRAS
jgi:putative transport protein